MYSDWSHTCVYEAEDYYVLFTGGILILFFKSANNFSFLLSIVFCVIRLRELECFFFFGVRVFGFEITLCMHTVVEMIPSRGITIRSTT